MLLTDNLRSRIKHMRQEISKFDQKCAKDEYTDTDAAWQVLYDLRSSLASMDSLLQSPPSEGGRKPISNPVVRAKYKRPGKPGRPRTRTV